jgi:16S rRNA processing protein RimM
MNNQRDRDRMAIGRVLRPHGVRGELRVEAFSDLIRSLQPSSEVFIGESEAHSTVLSIRPHRKQYLIRLEGCSDRTDAERYRNQEILISVADAAELPEGTYFHWQIIGLQVYADSGEALGEITEIIETGANDVYVVKKSSGEDLLIPAIEEVILDVNHEQGRIKVHLLPGMMD